MKIDRELTPAVSQYCYEDEYCYWNGESWSEPPPEAGYVFRDKGKFAAQIITDFPQGLPPPPHHGQANQGRGGNRHRW